jgi:Dienelactone hydrolase family
MQSHFRIVLGALLALAAACATAPATKAEAPPAAEAARPPVAAAAAATTASPSTPPIAAGAPAPAAAQAPVPAVPLAPDLLSGMGPKGGGAVFNHAAAQPALDAGVVYYGTAPADPAAYPKMKAALLGHFGGDDARVGATLPPAEAELKRIGKSYSFTSYAGAGHGFMRQQGARDGANLKAAEQSWAATIAFFKQTLEK